MAQFETTGSGYIDSGDRKVIRKVVVATGGELISVPQIEEGFPLSNVSVSNEAGGVRRAVLEYSQGGEGGASYNQYGKRIELTGGSREVPIYNHPNFKTLTADQVNQVQEEVEKRPSERPATVGSGAQNNLYQLLIRQIEYYIAPSLVARVSEIESNLPSTTDLCKVSEPDGVNSPGQGKWIITAITASPIGNRYEVTREYTYLEQPEVADFLYS